MASLRKPATRLSSWQPSQSEVCVLNHYDELPPASADSARHRARAGQYRLFATANPAFYNQYSPRGAGGLKHLSILVPIASSHHGLTEF